MRDSWSGLIWRLAVAAAAVMLLALAGCQAAQQAPAPTGTAAPAPAAEEAATSAPPTEAYPAAEEEPAIELPTQTYPAPVEEEAALPGQVPARPNASQVSAELIEAAPAADFPGYTLLRVKLLSSKAVEGMASVTDELVDQEMELLVETGELPALQPGDIFEAKISFMGDEKGANYYILEFFNGSN